MVAVLITFTDFGKKPLLENWLPWQQRNVYLQFLNLKILLMPSYKKSPSFKVIACSVLEFWAIYWAGGGKHPPSPGANRVNRIITVVALSNMSHLGQNLFLVMPNYTQSVL